MILFGADDIYYIKSDTWRNIDAIRAVCALLGTLNFFVDILNFYLKEVSSSKHLSINLTPWSFMYKVGYRREKGEWFLCHLRSLVQEYEKLMLSDKMIV